MDYTSLPQFYQGQEWRKFRLMMMQERTGADGLLLCAHCGKPIMRQADCIAHHVEELSMSNVNDRAISLNPANVVLVHQRCHNEIHQRFGGRLRPWQRKAYVVFGAPFSGASEYVGQAMSTGDLVLDTDRIWEALSLQGLHGRPRELNGVAFPVRDLVLDLIAKRAGNWPVAWIVSAEPYPSARQRLLERLGGEPIFMDATEEGCLERLHASEGVPDVALMERLIKEWFANRTDLEP